MSPELTALAQALIRQATKENVALAGFLLTSRAGRPICFGNTNESGHALADVHRHIAELIDACARRGTIVKRELPRVD